MFVKRSFGSSLAITCSLYLCSTRALLITGTVKIRLLFNNWLSKDLFGPIIWLNGPPRVVTRDGTGHLEPSIRTHQIMLLTLPLLSSAQTSHLID